MLHLPQTIVVRLHAHESDAVILTPKKWPDLVSLSAGFSTHGEDMDAARHRGLTYTRTLFICSLKWELRREHAAYGILG